MRDEFGRRELLSSVGVLGSVVAASPAVATRRSAVRGELSAASRPRTTGGDRRLWSHGYGSDVRTAVHGDLVVALVGRDLYGFDARSGDRRWSRPEVATSGTALVLVRDGVGLLYDGLSLHVFDPETGQRRWQEDTEGRVMATAIAGDRVASSDSAGNWYVHRLDDGTRVATGTAGNSLLTIVGFRDGRLFLSGDSTIRAVDVAEQSTVWTNGRAEFLWAWLEAGTIYAGATGDTAYAIDPETGSVRWSFVADAAESEVTYLWPRGESLFASSDGQFYELDPETHEQRWQFVTRGQRLLWPVHHDDDQVAARLGRTLHVLDRESGTASWSHEPSSGVAAYTYAGRTYYGVDDEKLVALARDGSERWHGSLPGEDAVTFPEVDVVDGVVVTRGDHHLVGWDRNTAPSVSISMSPASPVVGEPVTFEASVDDDSPPSELDVEWSFGDGATATGRAVEHAYEQPETYTVTATVTDPQGLRGTAERSVTVEKASPTPSPSPSPTADATAGTASNREQVPGFGLGSAAAGLAAAVAWLRQRRD